MRALPLLIAAALLTACGERAPEAEAPAASPPEPAVAGPAAAPEARAPVAPGLTAEGFGPLRIGMTRAEIVQALGEDANPDAVGGADPASCDQFRPARAPEGLLVMVEQGRLTRLSLIRGSTLKTDAGFGVGDTAAAVKAAYGARAQSSLHKYEPAPAEYVTVWAKGGVGEGALDPSARGIVYEVGGDGRVRAVHAGSPSIQYVEGCS